MGSKPPSPKPSGTKKKTPVPLPRKILSGIKDIGSIRLRERTHSSSDEGPSDDRRTSLKENIYVEEGCKSLLEGDEISIFTNNSDPFGANFEQSFQSDDDSEVFSSISFQSPLEEVDTGSYYDSPADVLNERFSDDNTSYYGSMCGSEPPPYSPPPPPSEVYDYVSYERKNKESSETELHYENVEVTKDAFGTKRITLLNGRNDVDSPREVPEPLQKNEEVSPKVPERPSKVTEVPKSGSELSPEVPKRSASLRPIYGSDSAIVDGPVSDKTKVLHYYDPVTFENGKPVFMDSESKTDVRRRNFRQNKWPNTISVIMEFDPLFTDGEVSNVGRRKCQSELEPMRSEQTPAGRKFAIVAPNTTRNVSVPTPDEYTIETNVLYGDAKAVEVKHSMPAKTPLMKKLSRLRKSYRRDSQDRLSETEVEETDPSTSGVMQKYSPSLRREMQHSSTLYKAAGNKKDFVARWCILHEGKFSVFQEKPKLALQEEIQLDKVLSISVFKESRVSPDLHDLQCFELQMSSPGKIINHLFGATTEQERRKWMQMLIETLTQSFSTVLLAEYERGGWAYVKEGVSGTWSPGWLLLKGRSLHYCPQGMKTGDCLDLRKARQVALQPKGTGYRAPPTVVESSEVLVVDFCDKTLYIQSEMDREVEEWRKCLQAAAVKNGLALRDLQLTQENVPVIVDKCIKFIYTHGCLQEGIYRQSGQNTKIAELLSRFQRDSWSVHLSPEEFSAHDVGGALKRFFRTLPEPLFTNQLYSEWIHAAGHKGQEDRVKEYKRILEKMPQEHYNTLKVLARHLHSVHELCEKNLMPVFNLAPIWGPTLMSVEATRVVQASFDHASAEIDVVKDLILLYPWLFNVDLEEIEKEHKIQTALEKLHVGDTGRKHSGDMRLWIYIFDKEGTSLSVTVAPSTSARTVCCELLHRAQIKEDLENVALFEVVCNDALERPLHYTEMVLETALRWSNWDETERKDNYLVLRKNNLYKRLLPWAKPPLSVFSELRFADKTKTFKKCVMEFSRAKMIIYKDSKSRVHLASWNIEDIVWYIGSDPKRKSTKWAFTFIDKQAKVKRSKDTPFFGRTACCENEEEFLRWIAAMLVGEYPNGLFPILPSVLE